MYSFSKCRIVFGPLLRRDSFGLHLVSDHLRQGTTKFLHFGWRFMGSWSLLINLSYDMKVNPSNFRFIFNHLKTVADPVPETK